MNNLCGTLFCFEGNKYDYCFKEAIQCLFEFCDHVVIICGGDDGTVEDIMSVVKEKEGKVNVIIITQQEWDEQVGKEKLNYFTNVAIQYADKLGFEYQFNLQSDEIVHQSSYVTIREAVQANKEGYMCHRINLWSSPYMQLSVPANRMPCSDYIVRLSKTNNRSYGDAESIDVTDVNTDYSDRIKIYHMGFVRKQEVMKSKIINMQQGVFAMDHYDPKLDQCELFNPDLWFDPKTDLKPIDEPLPKIIQQWAKDRIYE